MNRLKLAAAGLYTSPFGIVLLMTAYRLSGAFNTHDASIWCDKWTGVGCAKLTAYQALTSVLGDLMTSVGLPQNWFLMCIIATCYVLLPAGYAILMMLKPEPTAWDESYTTMMRRYPTASLGVRVGVPVLYLFGGLAGIGIIRFLWF